MQQLLTPPVFEDETQTHQAYILHYILLVLVAVPPAYSTTIWFTEPEYFGTALVQSLVSEAIVGFLFLLNRRGRTYLASILQIVFFWILFNGVSYTRLGVQGTAYILGNGIGIDPAHHERVFGLFNRLDPGVEGTGIGLTLAKRIIEVHGGRIWVESNPGEGAAFLFTLPRGSYASTRRPGEGGL